MTKRLPRYAWLHQTLLNDIESERYGVGTQLPTEHQLCHIYGVSRHTVREATRRLAEAGLITRTAGSGTVVIASRPVAAEPVFVSAFGSLQDLMRYTEQTRLEVLGEQFITLDPREAARLHVPAGVELLMLHTNRRLVRDGTVISYTRVYLPPEFAGVRDKLTGNHPSVFSILQSEYGQQIHKVSQQVVAERVPESATGLVDCKPGDMALGILRVYFDNAGRLLTASDNFYIPDRFSLMATWERP
ncbi:GntR family transcriptional regulator [Advenella kashmirensis]